MDGCSTSETSLSKDSTDILIQVWNTQQRLRKWTMEHHCQDLKVIMNGENDSRVAQIMPHKRQIASSQLTPLLHNTHWKGPDMYKIAKTIATIHGRASYSFSENGKSSTSNVNFHGWVWKKTFIKRGWENLVLPYWGLFHLKFSELKSPKNGSV